MSEALSKFLYESWQLFYWSLFFPGLLQKRMNEWSPEKSEEGVIKNTSSQTVLFTSRFTQQYLLLIVILSLPMGSLVDWWSGGWDTMSFLTAALIVYGFGFWFLPSGIGFCNVIIFSIMYWQQSNIFTIGIKYLFKVLPQLPQISMGICIGGMVITINTLVVCILFRKQLLILSGRVFWMGSGLSVFVGGWIITQNCFFSLAVMIPTSILFSLISDSATVLDLKYNRPNVTIGVISGAIIGVVSGLVSGASIVLVGGASMGVLIGSSIVVATVVAFVVAFVMAFGTMIAGTIGMAKGMFYVTSDVMAIITSFIAVLLFGSIITFGVATSVPFFVAFVAITPLPWFLLVSALFSFGCAPFQKKWLGIGLATVFVALGWENLNFQALWAIPLSLLFYYRVFPDYLMAYISSLVISHLLSNRSSTNSASLLTKIPPYTTELLWLPLTHHPRILAATFRHNTALGLTTFQKMQAILLPGFQITIKKSLSTLVADQLAEVKTTVELINSVTPTHPIIPILISAFYQYDPENTELLSTLKNVNPEIDLLFPIFQQITKDTIAALHGGSSALKERGLERLIDKLKI
jgi:hypothetical protein